MKRILSALAMTALAVLAIVTTKSEPIVPAVYASTGCTDATLTGHYAAIQPAGFTTLHSTTGREVPWQVVGVFTFDGKGSTSINYTAAVDGVVFTAQAAAGTYTVQSDCTGSLSLTTGDAAGYNANIVIRGGGAEVFGISTGAGDTASFDAKKQ